MKVRFMQISWEFKARLIDRVKALLVDRLALYTYIFQDERK